MGVPDVGGGNRHEAGVSDGLHPPHTLCLILSFLKKKEQVQPIANVGEK